MDRSRTAARTHRISSIRRCSQTICGLLAPLHGDMIAAPE
jgi:hypothetical protein